jgi:hypothetical protein
MCIDFSKVLLYIYHMKYIPRLLESEIVQAATQFSSILLSGPRRVGKTTLLRHAFPNASYVQLEDPDEIGRVRADPRGFVDSVSFPAILDEIQSTPELFSYIRTHIDKNPEQRGQWLLTGSQEASLMQGVVESMAGRTAIFQLLPFSTRESPAVSLIGGGFPEVIAQPDACRTWFRSYVQTYLERDVRSLSNISDLATYRRFMALLATRTGQTLNKTELAAPLGVSVPTIAAWLNILEITGQIILVPPFYENFGKRLTKSPKIYFVDSGLVCHLLGLETEDSLIGSPFLGPLFEGFAASEIVKCQLNANHRREIYFFRDASGLEVDLLVPSGDLLYLIECKASSTIRSDDARNVNILGVAIKDRATEKIVVCRGTNPLPVVAPGVTGVSVDQLISRLTRQEILPEP